MANTATAPKIMTLKCRHGEGHEWTRPAQRGKPPHFCPDHAPVKAAATTSKREKKTETPEEKAERKRSAEAIAKQKATIEAKRAEEIEQQRAQNVALIEQLKGEAPKLIALYEKCSDDSTKAFKKNATEEAFALMTSAERAQGRYLGVAARIKYLEGQVAA